MKVLCAWGVPGYGIEEIAYHKNVRWRLVRLRYPLWLDDLFYYIPSISRAGEGTYVQEIGISTLVTK